MTMTRNAVGNLMARYKTVLQNCSLLNTFGSLAAAIVVSGAVVFGGVGNAMSADYIAHKSTYAVTSDGKVVDAAGVVQTWASYDSTEDTVTITLGEQVLSGSSNTLYGAISNIAQLSGADVVGANVVVSGGTLSNNMSANAGGAMTLWTNANGDVRFSHSITGSNFVSNSAVSGGGALAIMGQNSLDTNKNGIVLIADAEFTKNSATGTNKSQGRGGAIWNQTNAGIKNTTFTANTATALGGAIYNEGMLVIGDTTFAGNTAEQAGGAIANLGDIILLDANFTNNSAKFIGGAIANNHGSTILRITGNYTRNSSGESGGAIYNEGVLGQVENTTFTENKTDGVGGAIHNLGTITFSGTNTFSGNTANGALNDIHNEGIINVSGNMILDGGISGTGTANFKSDSILTLGENTSIAQDAVSTEKGATLVVNSVKDINITEADIAEGSWGYNDGATSTISTSSAFIKLGDVTFDASTKNYTVSVTQKAATEALPNIDAGLGGLIDNAIKAGISSAGVNFIEEASKKNNGAAVIESAAKLSTGANVVGAVGSASTAAVANTGARTAVAGPQKASTVSETSTWLAMNGDALIIPTVDGGNMAQGFGLWFMPMYSHTSADGFKSGNHSYGYDTNIVGATLGADYTFAGDFRLGLAFNVGEGSSTSTGDFVSTDNDFNYYGLSLYGAKHFANIGLSFDMGYMFSENDMMQNADAGALGGSVDAGLFTLGTKAEYVIALDSFNVTPYAGLRFNYYTVDAYDTKQNGNTLFSTARSNSTVWEIPVGVAFDTTTKVGTWDMTPSLGLGVKFAMGDLDAEQSVSIAGVAGSSVLSSEVADDVTFQGSLGLGFTKDVCTIGLNYNLDLSENVESHGISVNLRYDF